MQKIYDSLEKSLEGARDFHQKLGELWEGEMDLTDPEFVAFLEELHSAMKQNASVLQYVLRTAKDVRAANAET